MAETNYDVGDGKPSADIQTALDLIPGDLGAEGGIQRVRAYAGGVQVGSAYEYRENPDAITGFTNAGASDYIALEAMVANAGQRDNGIVIMGQTTGTLLNIVLLGNYTRITGFGLTLSGAQPHHIIGVRVAAVGVSYITGMVIYDLHSSGSSRINYGIAAGDGADSYIRNCMVFDIHALTPYQSFGIGLNAGNHYADFCSVEHILGSSRANAYRFSNITSATLRNCIGTGAQIADFLVLSGASPTVTYCISEDGTADDWGGAGNQINKDADTDVKFASTTDGSEDLHLQDNTSVAYGAGVAVGGITTDIDGDTRADPPCIGADELPVVGVPQKTMHYSRMRRA